MANLVTASAAGVPDFDPFKLTLRTAVDVASGIFDDDDVDATISQVDAALGALDEAPAGG